MNKDAVRRCGHCKESVSLDRFFKSKSTRDGYSCWCKDCDKKVHRASWEKTDRAKQIVLVRGRGLRNKYGIDENEYQLMLIGQYGCCAICRISFKSDKPCVDHDHKTGKVRGLLCAGCNRMLGQGKDDVKILLRAVDCLEKNQNVPVS
mgnify:CR=1 FL=1